MSDVPIDDQVFRLVAGASRRSQGPAGAENHGPSLDTLPVEILLSVFEEGTYNDLKRRFPLVCRKFRDILQKRTRHPRSKIDRTLWRDHPRRPRPSGTSSCEINPLLRPGRLYWRCSQYEEPILRSNRSWGGFVRLADTPLRHENASSPAVSRCVFDMTVNGVLQPQLQIDGTGDGRRLTVMDIIDGVVDAIKGVKGGWKWRLEGVRWTGIEVRPIIVNGVLQLFAKM